MAILRKLSGCAWGPGAGTLRLTGRALVASFVRCGFAITWSGAYGGSPEMVNTCLINILERRRTVLGRTAGLSALLASAGLLDARNLYSRCSEDTLDLVRRSGSSSVAYRRGT